jgi:hypothetical protein
LRLQDNPQPAVLSFHIFCQDLPLFLQTEQYSMGLKGLKENDDFFFINLAKVKSL